MTDAAKLYEKTPMAMRLRELQTLQEISREGNLIIVPGGDIGKVAGAQPGAGRSVKRSIIGHSGPAPLNRSSTITLRKGA